MRLPGIVALETKDSEKAYITSSTNMANRSCSRGIIDGKTLMANRLLLALKDIVDWLEKQQIPYMIFGGIANTLYGNPRQTFDIDIKISIPSNKEKSDFIEHLRNVAVLLPAHPMQFIDETGVLPVTLHDVRIDFVFAQLPFEKQAIERSRNELFFSVPMKVCTVEDFILQKAVSTRRKDWDDIETVIDIQKNALDWPYLLEHCRELSDFLNDSTIVTRIQKMR